MREFLKNYYFWFLLLCVLGAATYVFSYWDFSGPIEYVSPRVSGNAAEEIPLPPVKHIETPDAVRGIYVTSWVAGTKSWRDDLVRFIDRTELNAVVIDVKDYTGKISFETSDEKLNALGYSEKRIPDIKAFIETLHRKNIYVIGRISVFQDPHLVKKRPDLAVKTKSGSVWKDRKGISWIDPASQEAWDIYVRIGRESEKVGFDELNFDYIRFPSDGNMSDIAYTFWDETIKRSDVMNNFFAYLDKNLADAKVPISADVFGLTSSSQNDLNIGQVLENALANFDYVSPMVYPSHYPTTFLGYKNPAEHPYEVIKSEMDKAVARAEAMGQDKNKIRPWIQDFDLGATYDAAKIELQKKAIYDAGLSGWLSWDPGNHYTKEAYLPIEE